MVNQTFVPKIKRGPQLTFQETGNQNTFMFAQSNTFIQIDGDMIQTFQLRYSVISRKGFSLFAYFIQFQAVPSNFVSV